MRSFFRLCLFTLIGMFAGSVGGIHYSDIEAAAIRREEPGRHICGLIILPYMFWGSMLGAVVGIWASTKFENRCR